MKTALTWLTAAVIMALLVVHETGIFDEHFGPGDPAGQRLLAAPETVGELVVVREAELGIRRWASGQLSSSHVVQVFPEIGGRVLELSAELGSRVSAGDVLARLDEEAAALEVEKAQAAVTLAKSRIAAAQAAVEAADTAIAAAEVQRQHAEVEAARQEELKAKHATTDQALQAAATAQKAAIAQVASARAQKQQASAEVTSATEAVRLAEVRQRDAERMLSKCRVTAPTDGVVQARFIEAGSMASPGAPLLALRPTAELDAVAWFPEDELPELGEELALRIGGKDLGKLPVTELGTEVESFTRTRAVRVALGSLGIDLGTLATGGFCELGLSRGMRTLLVIPAEALRRQGQIQSVRIETDRGLVEQHVRTAPLTKADSAALGLPKGDWLEVLAGLKPGDRVEVKL